MGQRGHCKSRVLYFFNGKKGKENHLLGTGFFVHHREEVFVIDRMSYIELRGRWCNVIVLNVHALTDEKSYDSKDRFMRNQSTFSITFLSTT